MNRSAPRSLLMLALASGLFVPNAARAQCTNSNLFVSGFFAQSFPNPRRLVVADFNADGRLDRAIAIATGQSPGLSSGVEVEFGNGTGAVGDGTFAAPQTYSTPFGTSGIGAADFDHDGILDLAVSNLGVNTVSLLKGIGCGGVGSGTFAPPANFAAGSGPHGLVVADFDSDTDPDVAVANNGIPGGVSVLLGDGAMHLSAPTTYSLANRSVGIAVGDFNEDGHPDLVATEFTTHTVAVLIGHGDGTFATPVSYSAGVEPYDITIGDFDEDGIADLAVGNANSGGVAILRGDGAGGVGNGGFLPPPTLYAPGKNIASITTLDANQDGILDLAFAYSTPPQVGLLLGLGIGGVGNGTFTLGPAYNVGANPAGLVVADFNEDGTNDLAGIAYDDTSSWVLYGHCEENPTPTTGTTVLTSEIVDGRVHIAWSVASSAVPELSVQRRTTETDWETVSRSSANSFGRIDWTDASVAPGTRYGYRVLYSSGDFAGEVWLDVPGFELALAGGRPNPARNGRLDVSFTLPGSGPATLELLDIGGRRITNIDVGSQGAGRHVVDLAAGRRLPSGVYVVRLSRAGRAMSTKISFAP